MANTLLEPRPKPLGDSVLEVDNLQKSFGGTPALDGVSFGLERGKIHALLGGNGSGKSTTIKILAGVYVADGGTVRLGVQELAAQEITPHAVRDAGVRFVHQQASTFPDLTVTENLLIGRGFELNVLGTINWRAANRRAAEVLERFHISARPRDLLSRLSLANQTMVAIARALQDLDDANSGVLVLDEPTSALPPAEVERLLVALGDFAHRGQTIMYVTHRLEEVARIADAATILRDGKVVASISRDEISHDRLVELITGKPDAAAAVKVERSRSTTPALVVRDAFAGPIRGLSVNLHQGEIVGIAGLLGSGRSTLLRTLFGLTPLEDGRIELNGRNVAASHPKAAIDSGFAYVPEDRAREATFPDLSITENLGMVATPDYFTKGFLRHRRERSDARSLLAQHWVKAASEDVPISTLSGGNQQKVIVARWLRLSPRILLLDEPSQGVDIGARREIWELIRAAVDDGAAALVVSSDFEELAAVCDRALVLRHGKFIAELDGKNLTAHELEHTLLRVEEH